MESKGLIQKAIKDISRKYSDFSIAISYLEQITADDENYFKALKAIEFLNKKGNDASRALAILGVTEEEMDKISRYKN